MIKSILVTAFVAMYLPGPIFMIWVHAFTPLWRRIGAASYWIHTPLYLGMVAAVIWKHALWTAETWRFPWVVEAVGVALIIGSLVVLGLTYREVDWRLTTAMRQVDTTMDGGLVTTGIYGVIRHPRYVILLTGSLGTFLWTGSAAVLVTFVVTSLLVSVTVRLEEAELVARYGEDYLRYRERVPGFIPRMRR